MPLQPPIAFSMFGCILVIIKDWSGNEIIDRNTPCRKDIVQVIVGEHVIGKMRPIL